jgi:hypothetical protein
MAYLQIEDVLERLRRFHMALSSYFESVRDGNSSDGRQSQILATMRDQEVCIAESLERVQSVVDDLTRLTWLQFDPDPELWRMAEEELTRAFEENPGRALEVALNIDRGLTSLYDKIASAQVPPRVRNLFVELARMQRSRMRRRALESLDTEI